MPLTRDIHSCPPREIPTHSSTNRLVADDRLVSLGHRNRLELRFVTERRWGTAAFNRPAIPAFDRNAGLDNRHREL